MKSIRSFQWYVPKTAKLVRLLINASATLTTGTVQISVNSRGQHVDCEIWESSETTEASWDFFLQRSYGSNSDEINEEIVFLTHFKWVNLKCSYSVFLLMLIVDKVCLVFRENENRSSIFVVCNVMRSNRKRRLIRPMNVDIKLS